METLKISEHLYIEVSCHEYSKYIILNVVDNAKSVELVLDRSECIELIEKLAKVAEQLPK